MKIKLKRSILNTKDSKLIWMKRACSKSCCVCSKEVDMRDECHWCDDCKKICCAGCGFMCANCYDQHCKKCQSHAVEFHEMKFCEKCRGE